MNSFTSPIVICPSCKGKPSITDKSIDCPKCKKKFRLVGGIPWLFLHPEKTFYDWKSQILGFLDSFDKDIQKIESALKGTSLPSKTKERLESLHDAKKQAKRTYALVLKPFIEGEVTPPPWQAVPQTKIPLGLSVTSYAPNLFRDWCWGNEENQASLDIVRKLLPNDLNGKKVCVLGSGASRLAYDLHQSMRPAQTIAVDQHPLFVLAANQIIQGKKVELFEFPLAPIGLKQAAEKRVLEAPQKVNEGFSFVFADALNPPFSIGAFDYVLTPWFIDVVPEECGRLLKRINQLLSLGGSWIHFGPLGFQSQNPANNYSIEEILELSEQGGFRIQKKNTDSIQYLSNPSSSHSRRETVYSILAEKINEVELLESYSYLPEWLTDSLKPVPLMAQMGEAMNTAMVATSILSLIDGKRSISDIAKHIEQKTKTPEDFAKAAVIGFLTQLYETTLVRS